MDKRTFLKTSVAGAALSVINRAGVALATPVGAAGRGTAARSNADRSTAVRRAPAWALDVSVMESCSCRVFCQCFFTGLPLGVEQQEQQEQHAGPAAHDAHAASATHACQFNQAYRVNAGYYGDVRLDGAKFWYAGNAGPDLREKVWDWSVLTFDADLSPVQRDALLGMLRTLRFYRAERWHSHTVADPAPVEWARTADGARASLGGGRLAELALTPLKGQHDGPVLVQNLGYFGYPRNSGFEMMPSAVQAYRVGERAFEHRGTNGFLTTVQMTADDFPPPSR